MSFSFVPQYDYRNRNTWDEYTFNTQRPPLAIISPSILACNFTELGNECEAVLSSVYTGHAGATAEEHNKGSEWLHVDIMDGVFVPNISIGICVVESLRKRLPSAFLDCHLMIADPLFYIADFAKSGASQYTFHVEAALEAYRKRHNNGGDDGSAPAPIDIVREVCLKVKEAGMLCGVAIKPGTIIRDTSVEGNEKSNSSNTPDEPLDASFLLNLVPEGCIDLILVMTVEPGFGGQKFMRSVLHKTNIFRRHFPTLNIQVDGGINKETATISSEQMKRDKEGNGAAAPAAVGGEEFGSANVMVAGTSIFGKPDRIKEIIDIRDAVAQNLV